MTIKRNKEVCDSYSSDGFCFGKIRALLNSWLAKLLNPVLFFGLVHP